MRSNYLSKTNNQFQLFFAIIVIAKLSFCQYPSQIRSRCTPGFLTNVNETQELSKNNHSAKDIKRIFENIDCWVWFVSDYYIHLMVPTIYVFGQNKKKYVKPCKLHFFVHKSFPGFSLYGLINFNLLIAERAKSVSQGSPSEY